MITYVSVKEPYQIIEFEKDKIRTKADKRALRILFEKLPQLPKLNFVKESHFVVPLSDMKPVIVFKYLVEYKDASKPTCCIYLVYDIKAKSFKSFIGYNEEFSATEISKSSETNDFSKLNKLLEIPDAKFVYTYSFV